MINDENELSSKLSHPTGKCCTFSKIPDSVLDSHLFSNAEETWSLLIDTLIYLCSLNFCQFCQFEKK